MNYIWAVFRREVKSYLVSPLTYTAIAVSLAIQGVLFHLSLGTYATRVHQASQNPMLEIPGAEMLVRAMLGPNVMWMLLIIIPLLTMRLLAEERKQHTAELLLTAPMTTLQLVIGKYLGAAFVLAVMLLFSVWMPATIHFWGGVGWAPIISGYLGAFLYGAVLLALGLLASSLTDSSMIAAFFALLMIALVNVAGVMAPQIPVIGQNLEKFTPSANLTLLANGVIDSQALVFFATTIIFLVDLTARVVDSQRWR